MEWAQRGAGMGCGRPQQQIYGSSDECSRVSSMFTAVCERHAASAYGTPVALTTVLAEGKMRALDSNDHNIAVPAYMALLAPRKWLTRAVASRNAARAEPDLAEFAANLVSWPAFAAYLNNKH